MWTAVYRSAFVFVLALAAVAAWWLIPDSFPRSQALYVEMRDGVRIAIDVWLEHRASLSDAEREIARIETRRKKLIEMVIERGS